MFQHIQELEENYLCQMKEFVDIYIKLFDGTGKQSRDVSEPFCFGCYLSQFGVIRKAHSRSDVQVRMGAHCPVSLLP